MMDCGRGLKRDTGAGLWKVRSGSEADIDDHALREATNGFGRVVEGAGKGREAEMVALKGREPKPL